MQQWYAVQVKSSCKEKVAQLLKKKKLDFFAPYLAFQVSSDQNVSDDSLLFFQSIFFVRCPTSYSELMFVIYPFANLLFWQKEPATFPHSMIQILKKFVESESEVVIKRIAVQKFEPARIFETHSNLFVYSKNLLLPALGFELVAKSSDATVGKLKHIHLIANSGLDKLVISQC